MTPQSLLSSLHRAELSELLGDQVEFDKPLAGKVAYRIGGPADAYARPRTEAALAGLFAWADAAQIPVTILGTGSNVLVSDRGIRGITVRLAGELADVHVASPGAAGAAGTLVDAGAGALNAPLVALALSLDLVGIEFLATIPGTFGGALIMNAGAHGGEIAPFVQEVWLLDSARRRVVRAGAECGFGYRQSGFATGEFLLGARLSLPRGDAGAARTHLDEMRKKRRATQPLDAPNAGSIFKNPPGEHAGRLIEACGLKGQRVGGAEISTLHANFIINRAQATAQDVVDLAARAEDAVRARFGVALEWEVKRIGEW